jgi:hypothetical protein
MVVRTKWLYLLLCGTLATFMVVSIPQYEASAAEALPCDESNPDCDNGGGGGDGGCVAPTCTCQNAWQQSWSTQCSRCAWDPLWGDFMHWQGFVSVVKQCPCSTRTITCWYNFSCGGCDIYK